MPPHRLKALNIERVLNLLLVITFEAFGLTLGALVVEHNSIRHERGASSLHLPTKRRTKFFMAGIEHPSARFPTLVETRSPSVGST